MQVQVIVKEWFGIRVSMLTFNNTPPSDTTAAYSGRLLVAAYLHAHIYKNADHNLHPQLRFDMRTVPARSPHRIASFASFQVNFIR